MKTVTIIGAGLGGLTAGALLAQKGYKVTIVEQHNSVGGSATTFRRKGGFTCEVGLHEMDGVFSDKRKKEIFEALKVYDHVEFVKPNEFFRVTGSVIDFTMPDGRDKAIMALCEKYPSEERAIKKYFALIQKLSDEFNKLSTASWWQYALFPFVFSNILRYRTASVKKVMDGFIKDEQLKLILNANIGYFNDTINDFSFLYHSLAQHSYYKGGGWYIKGGSQQLSNYLASVIKKHDGEVITKANVVKIDHNHKNSTSITYMHKKEEIEVKSDILISNLAPSATYKLAHIDYSETKKVASSLLSIYIGFKRNLKSVYGKRAYSTFLLREAQSMEDYDKNVQGNVENRGIVFVDYSQIDSGLTDASKSFGAICSTDYLSDWEGLEKEAYKQKKHEVLESYLNLLETEYPNIREHIEFAEVGTAKTIQRYLKTAQGTAYGFAPTDKQFFRVPKVKSKKLDNLYFVGAWVIGGGFTPAILSGGLGYREVVR